MLKRKLILPLSILAAAWMIMGPDWMAGWGIANDKWMIFLTWLPVTIIFWMIISSRPGFYACEKRAFRRMLGLGEN